MTDQTPAADEREQALAAALRRLEFAAIAAANLAATDYHPAADLALVRAALAPELPADLAEIQARIDAATPGPWDVREEIDGRRAGRRTAVAAGRLRVVTVDQTRSHHDATAEANVEFIARARTDVPALVAELAERRAAPQLTAEEAGILVGAYPVDATTAGLAARADAKLRAIAEQATP